MADEKMIHAKQVYETLCKGLDEENWNYKKDEANLRIQCGAQGDDLPIEMTIGVDVERQLVMVLSKLPYKIPEDKRLDIAVAVSVINDVLVDGCVDYNVATGELFFRMTNSFVDSLPHQEVFKYMVMCAAQTIDGFNDKLFMLGKGMMTLERFVEDYAKE